MVEQRSPKPSVACSSRVSPARNDKSGLHCLSRRCVRIYCLSVFFVLLMTVIECSFKRQEPGAFCPSPLTSDIKPLYPAPDSAEQFIRNAACVFRDFFRADRLISFRTDQHDGISDCGFRNIRNIYRHLIHTNSSDDRSAFPPYEDRACSGQAARYAVCVSCGNNGNHRIARRNETSPVSYRFSLPDLAGQNDARFQCKHRLQVCRRHRFRFTGAHNPIQCNARPDIIIVEIRVIEEAAAVLYV